jgi:3alpha(or 20beta)-hydroxysteroid dehydrogenase
MVGSEGMTGRLEGKVAIITGGAQGQGAVQARRFVAEGAKVAIADTLRDKGEALAAELGAAARFVDLDVGDENSWSAAIEQVERAFGHLNVLVNGGGINCTAFIEDTSVAQFMELVRINQLGPWLGMRAMIAPMQRCGGGAIVNNVSASVVAGLPGKSAYAGTKGAMRAIGSIVAREFGAFNIRVNSVLPGAVATELNLAQASLEQLDAQCADLPIPRIGLADEIARAVVFLASDESSYTTGAELVIDGGQTAAPLNVSLASHRAQRARSSVGAGSN